MVSSVFMFMRMLRFSQLFLFFFFNDTATTEIYTLSLHDALPICPPSPVPAVPPVEIGDLRQSSRGGRGTRSEEHTSELQSHLNLVCRLLLEKKKADPCTSPPGPTCTRPFPTCGAPQTVAGGRADV